MLPWIALLSVLILLAPVQTADPLEQNRAAAIEKWENDIRDLEKLDQEQKDPEHAVLFLGSSSIRLWNDIKHDMAPYSTIRRGYGGAKFSDLAVFVDRLVRPHRFDAVVLFVGNDVSGDESDKTPAEVVRLIDITVNKIKEHSPTAPIFLIAITPTPKRFAVWEKIAEVNAAMATYCQTHEGLHYIDTVNKYLGSDGKPIESYFGEDQLHQNRDGYQAWSQVIKAALDRVLSPKE